MAVHHVVVVHADYQHDEGPHRHADGRAQRPRDRQESRPRHDKRPPADGASKRQRPDPKRGQITLQILVVHYVNIYKITGSDIQHAAG